MADCNACNYSIMYHSQLCCFNLDIDLHICPKGEHECKQFCYEPGTDVEDSDGQAGTLV